MSDLLQQLGESIKIVEENKRLRALVQRQRTSIRLMHAQLSVANIKLKRARMDGDETPAFHRQQA